MISGEKGMLKFDETDQTVTSYSYKIDQNFQIESEKPEIVFQHKAPPLQAELEHFIQCCDTRSTPKTDGMQGERVVKMMEMAMQQLKEGEQGSHA